MSLDRVYDITLVLRSGGLTYPGDPPFVRDLVASHSAGDPAEVGHLSLCAHAGTHLDAPAHFLAGGRRLDAYAAGDFVLPARVVVVDQTRRVPASAIAEAQAGVAVLLKTRNSARGLLARTDFVSDYVHLSAAAAALCVARGVPLVGIDALSVDPHDSTDYPAHRTLAAAGALVLEGADLRDVPPGDYTLVCLPLRVADAEAAPARAVLLPAGLSLGSRRATPRSRVSRSL